MNAGTRTTLLLIALVATLGAARAHGRRRGRRGAASSAQLLPPAGPGRPDKKARVCRRATASRAFGGHSRRSEGTKPSAAPAPPPEPAPAPSVAGTCSRAGPFRTGTSAQPRNPRPPRNRRRPAPAPEPAPAPATNSIYWGAWIGSQLTGTEAPWDMNAVSAFEGDAAEARLAGPLRLPLRRLQPHTRAPTTASPPPRWKTSADTARSPSSAGARSRPPPA